jgi:hypothetical protein
MVHMSGIALFAAEVLATVMLSWFIMSRLQGMLRQIGSQLCERGAGSAEFWVIYTQLMMFIAPLILVAVVSQAGAELSPVAHLRLSLLVVLSGQFLGLVLVGRTVWVSLTAPARAAAAPSS